MKKIFTKRYWTEIVDNAIALWQGAQYLAENASLVIVSGFTVLTVFNTQMNLWLERGLLAAAAIIAFRGLVEVGKDLMGVAVARAKQDDTRNKKINLRTRV